MKYLIGEITKLWWIAAVVVVTSCAPATSHQLKGLADTSLEKSQLGGAGTTGGNPLTGLEVEGKNPNGSVAELALCIDPTSLIFLGGNLSGGATKTATLLPIANARVDLVKGQLAIDVQGIAIPDILLGVEFDLVPHCGESADGTVVGGSSAMVLNQFGTTSTSRTVHVSIAGATSIVPVDKSTVKLTLGTDELLRNLAGVQTEDQLVGAFGGTAP